jgi:hypothetical protein
MCKRPLKVTLEMWLGAENESFNVVTWSIILVKEM